MTTAPTRKGGAVGRAGGLVSSDDTPRYADKPCAEYSARDEMWAEAVEAAKEEVRKANEVIRARCEGIGVEP